MQLRAIEPQAAAAALAGMAGLDPRGLATEADTLAMCRACQCFEVQDGESRACIVVSVRNGVHWINAAAGTGPACLTSAITAALAAAGAQSIAFQTARPGLVRKAKRLGYRITGYIMRRDQ